MSQDLFWRIKLRIYAMFGKHFLLSKMGGILYKEELPVYNLNRVFLLSFGIICLILIPFFWGAVHFLDYIAFENFIVRLTSSKFVGYPIPELVGSSNQVPLQENISHFKNIFVSLLSFYGIFLISISYVPTSGKRWKLFSLSLGFPLLFILFGLWLKFINDDHIIGTFEKQQLFQFTYILIIATTCCFFIGFRKPRIKKRKKAQAKPYITIDKVSPAEKSQIVPPSTDVTLNDNEPSGEEELKQDSKEVNGSGPEEIPMTENMAEPLNEEGNDNQLGGVTPEGLQEELQESSDQKDELENSVEVKTEEEVQRNVENVLPPQEIVPPGENILPPLESYEPSEEAFPQEESVGDGSKVVAEKAGKPN